MMTQEEIIAIVRGFAKANPQTVAQLRETAIEILKPCEAEMTASELEAAKVAFCLGGVWSLINIQSQINSVNYEND